MVSKIRSLWNIVKNKNREVIEYIEHLEEPKDNNEKIRFNKIRKKALAQNEANDKLEAIGYVAVFNDYHIRPLIYDWSIEKELEK